MSLSIIQAFYEFSVMYNYEVLPDWFDLWALLRINMITSSMAGITAGLVVFPLINTWLRTHSYRLALLYSAVIITLSFFAISTCGTFIFNTLKYDAPVNDARVLSEAVKYLGSTENLKNFLFWLLIGVATIVGIQIKDKYGPGNFSKFLLGKYFHPKEENRIFMFLDIRSSTAIAEQLEEVQYFEFLRDFFNDVTPAILRSQGNIYKYVGDEIIINWTYKEGFKSGNCVTVFFDIKEKIRKRARHYKTQYNVEPSFKVGIHAGKTVVGEIGMIKRDITYSGDVLNTASRIQSMCNDCGVDILYSKKVAEHLQLDSSTYHQESIGEVRLRGKKEELELFTIVIEK